MDGIYHSVTSYDKRGLPVLTTEKYANRPLRSRSFDSYDASGRLRQATGFNQRQINYAHGAHGLINSLSGNYGVAGTVGSTYEYDPGLRPTAQVRSNGMRIEHDYDPRGMLAGITARRTQGGTGINVLLQGHEYGHDAAGRKTFEKHLYSRTTGTVAGSADLFRHDELSRLTGVAYGVAAAASLGGGSAAYAASPGQFGEPGLDPVRVQTLDLDRLHNRRSVEVDGVTTLYNAQGAGDYQADPLNQLNDVTSLVDVHLTRIRQGVAPVPAVFELDFSAIPSGGMVSMELNGILVQFAADADAETIAEAIRTQAGLHPSELEVVVLEGASGLRIQLNGYAAIVPRPEVLSADPETDPVIVGEDDGRSRVRFLLDAYPAGEPIVLVIDGVAVELDLSLGAVGVQSALASALAGVAGFAESTLEVVIEDGLLDLVFGGPVTEPYRSTLTAAVGATAVPIAVSTPEPGVSEVWVVQFAENPQGGTLRLQVGASIAEIPWDPDATDQFRANLLAAALQSLPEVGTGGVLVNPSTGGGFSMEFLLPLAGVAVPELSAGESRLYGEVYEITYDFNGNLLSDDQGRQYEWSATNRLLAVRDSVGSLIEAYAHDAYGRRVASHRGTAESVRYRYYEGWEWVLETDYEGNVIVEILPGVEQDRPVAFVRNGQAYYFVQNDLGHVTAIVDANGSVVQRYRYDAFGEFEILDTNGNVLTGASPLSPLLYSAHPYDESTGLIHARHRYYRPDWGRWISADPLHYIDGMNRYAYVRGNVVNLVDPMGLYMFGPNSGTIWKMMATLLSSEDNVGAVGFTREFAANGMWMVGTLMTPEDLYGMYENSVERISLAASSTAGEGVTSQAFSVIAATGSEVLGLTLIIEGYYGIDLHGRDLTGAERGLNIYMGVVGVASSAMGGANVTRGLSQLSTRSVKEVAGAARALSRRAANTAGDFGTGFKKGFDTEIRAAHGRLNSGVDPTPLFKGAREGVRHVLSQNASRQAIHARIKANISLNRQAIGNSGFGKWSRGVEAGVAERPVAIPGDKGFVGPHKKSWLLTPDGDGAHLVEIVNVRNRLKMTAYDQPGTPRFYPAGTPENAGQAHIRLHQATKAAGIRLRGGNPGMADQQLINAYRRAYSDSTLKGIRGDLRTPDGRTVIGTNLSPSEAFKRLLRWGGN